MEAFGDLCRVLEPRLLRQALLVCGNASLAEELVQETLIEAWACLNRYNGACQFFTWLCAILHNRHRNVIRRRRWLIVFGWAGAEQTEVSGLLAQQTDEEAWPDQAAQSREQAALVRKCIQALPMKHQQVIYLRFFVDDSLEGIAAALGCSVGTVKSRLFHALEKLRSMHALREPTCMLNQKVSLV